MMTGQLIRLNPSLEAFSYGKTLALFVDDRVLTVSGKDNVNAFQRLRSLLVKPLLEEEIAKQAPDLFALLPNFLSADILLKDKTNKDITFAGSGSISSSLQKIFKEKGKLVRQETPLLICFPDRKGLGEQNKALQQLRPGQSLLTGIHRGTSVFVLPLISDPKTDLLCLVQRLLSTEPGIGNVYFFEEVSGKQTSTKEDICFEKDVADWIAADLYAMISSGRLDSETARIYRGSQIAREDVSLAEISIPISAIGAEDQKADALMQMFVGRGKFISKLDAQVFWRDDAPYYAACADIARPRMRASEKESLDSWGTASTLSLARLKALMEAIERHSTGAYELEQHPLRARNTLDLPVLDRLIVAGYGEGDDYYEDLTPDIPRRWHVVTKLDTGEKFLLPLELVRYPVCQEEVGHPVHDHVTSSGVASHFIENRAISSACHELVERDAFLIAWLRKASPPLINLASLPDCVRSRTRALEQSGFEIRMIDLTADLAPCVCVLIIDKNKEPVGRRFNVGASSNDDVETACLKALDEAHLLLTLSQGFNKPSEKSPDDLRTPLDHIELYATGRHDDLLLTLFCSSIIRDFSDIKRFSGSVTERILNSGLDIFIAHLEVPVLQRIAPSINVVRAIVPGLVPIQFGQYWPRTGSPRIATIPELIGWDVLAKQRSEYQRFPHPFP
jgi:thiazole/oxazole-forming peptide maturase SagD family component